MKNNGFNSLLKKQIDRRSFLKGSALLGMTGMVSSIHGADMADRTNEFALPNKEKKNGKKYPDFKFNKEGKFKILQLTDTHYIAGNPNSVRALENVKQMLDIEKPDLVIHTGDVVFGQPAEQSAREILQPIVDRKIPFAVAFGNHDEEFDKTRPEMLDIVMSLPGNVNTKEEGIFGVTNCALTISSPQSNKIERVIYLFDSNRGATIEDIPKTYGHIHFDQIAWYRNQSETFTKNNGGIPIPSFAFFHIPLPEHKEATRDDVNSAMRGNRGENVASPTINSGLFVSMKEMKDVDAVFVGHDHNSDFAIYWNKMFFIYGRFSGCDNVYNDLKPNGARVIELTEGDKGFHSWVRLFGGAKEQDFLYPKDFVRAK